jgi:hypothetical protein
MKKINFANLRPAPSELLEEKRNRRFFSPYPSKAVSGSNPSSSLELLHQRLKVHVIPAFDDLVAFDNGKG